MVFSPLTDLLATAEEDLFGGDGGQGVGDAAQTGVVAVLVDVAFDAGLPFRGKARPDRGDPGLGGRFGFGE